MLKRIYNMTTQNLDLINRYELIVKAVKKIQGEK